MEQDEEQDHRDGGGRRDEEKAGTGEHLQRVCGGGDSDHHQRGVQRVQQVQLPDLVLVKPLPTLKCSSQVNILNVYVVEGLVTTINAGADEFNKSKGQI